MQSGVTERFLASRLLTIASARASARIDTFTGWLMGGGAVVLGLAGGNKAASAGVVHGSLYVAAALFFFAAILVVAEKYLAVLIGGMADSANHSEERVRKLLEDGMALDLDLVVNEMMKVVRWPFKGYADRQLRALRNGDLAASGRSIANLSYLQGYIAISAAAVLLIALGVLIF